MTARRIKVKHRKRGATWEDGTTRTCTRCRIEKNHGDRRQANAATTIGLWKDGDYVVPFGYCPQHTPEELRP